MRYPHLHFLRHADSKIGLLARDELGRLTRGDETVPGPEEDGAVVYSLFDRDFAAHSGT